MPGSSSTNPTDPAGPRPRILTVDLIRWFSFYAIVIYHLTFALWAHYGLTTMPVRGPWIWPLENYARGLAFSGFTIVLLSFFMLGFNGGNSRKGAHLPLFLVGFAMVWLLTVEQFPFWWDIYPYLLGVLAILWGARRLQIPPQWLALIGGIVVSIPFWLLEKWAALPLGLSTVVLGACERRADLGDWPLLPWLGYPLFAVGIGQLAAGHRSALSRMSRPETFVWMAALGASGPWLGGYFNSPLGEEFGCAMFRRAPLEFWAHQLWILFLVRLGLMAPVTRALGQLAIVRWISLSPVNRRFFWIYFIHYPLAFAAAWLARGAGVDHAPWILAVTFILLFLIVECHKLVPFPEAPWLRTNAKSSTI